MGVSDAENPGTSKSGRKTLILTAVCSVTFALAAGILIGYYAISPSCAIKQKEFMDPPFWPFVAHTWNRYPNMHVAKTAWSAVQQSGDSHLLAVVAALSDAEMDDTDISVAAGNKPDDTGETTLDAMIMDGETHDVGAVGGLRGVKNAIAAAYAVLKYTKHTLLVGDMASEFALSMGVPAVNLSNEAEINTHKSWLQNDCQPNFRQNVIPDPSVSCGPYNPTTAVNSGTNSILDSSDHDTIGVLAIDSQGRIAAGTSTNGLRHKVHGRVGDSPIPGAGSYVDKNIGACTATGNGDIMVRFLPCLQAIQEMRNGKTAREAAQIAMDMIDEYYNNYSGAILVVYKDGTYGGACSGYDSYDFVYQHAGMDEPKSITWVCDQ